MNYAIKKTTNLSYEEAIEKVTLELSKEGFGVLTKVDVKETFKKKIDKDFDKYIILGACNPHFAFNALATEKDIGLLLPCNLVVYEDNGQTIVAAIDPIVGMGFVENSQLEEVAKEVKQKLEKVIENI